MAAKKTPKTQKTQPKAKPYNSLDRKTKRRPELVVKAIADPKTRAKLARKRQPRMPMTWREWTMLGLLATCVVAVACSFAVKASFNPERDAEQALERLVNAYYTEYLYPQTINGREDKAAVMGQYKETGLPLVYLRQFFTFNEKKYANERKYFANEYYKCDENASRVHFVPAEPYGEGDYTWTSNMSCERVE